MTAGSSCAATSRAASSRARGPGGRSAFVRHGGSSRTRRARRLQLSSMLLVAHDVARAGAVASMTGHEPTRQRGHLDAVGAQAMRDGHLVALEPGRHRVGVALEAHETRGVDDRRRGQRRGERGGGQRAEPLELGQIAHRRAVRGVLGEHRRRARFAHQRLQPGHRTRPGVAGPLAERVEAVLCLRHGRGVHRAPEALGREVDGLLDGALAVATTRRAGHERTP